MKRTKEIEAKLREYIKNLFNEYPEINTIGLEVDITRNENHKDIKIFEMNDEVK